MNHGASTRNDQPLKTEARGECGTFSLQDFYVQDLQESVDEGMIVQHGELPGASDQKQSILHGFLRGWTAQEVVDLDILQ